MQIKLTNKEIRESLEVETPSFPKYVTQIINLANQNAQGTRPRVVGQLSDLIQEFTGKTIDEWEQWYLQKYPDAIKTAKEKILEMVENLKDAINKIDDNMVNDWVWDLVIVKTFLGLKFQEAILKKAAEIKGVDYRLSDNTDESKGIDGYIGDIPVSIKPDTYKVKRSLSENIDVKIIYYKKVKDGIEVDYGEIS
ncbi:MjaI restriction endonuclease [bacterium BMS3Bbin06]|nr:MjaI restriction endonuclease [bacterium BMS3Abin08]GBE34858.1 MjaI restriction endonuclease [bacterium BMS3Bbin06]HDY70178.1 MjaI family restriction endonuclease [Nitrospirota bacterium]